MNQPHREDWRKRLEMLDAENGWHMSDMGKIRWEKLKSFIRKERKAVRAETVRDILQDCSMLNWEPYNVLGHIENYAKSKGISLTNEKKTPHKPSDCTTCDEIT